MTFPNESMNKAILESLPDAVLVINDLDDVLTTNSEFYRVRRCHDDDCSACAASAAMPKHYMSLFPDEQRGRIKDALSMLFSLDKLVQPLSLSNVKLKTWCGKDNDVDLRLSRVEQASERLAILLIRDMSERIKIEHEREKAQQQLRYTQKMVAIGKLTGGVAHEFNNMLASILGYGELAQESAGECDDETLKFYISQIVKSGDRAKELVEMMLSFSRGALKREVEALSLKRVLEEFVRGDTKERLGEAIEVKLDVEENIPSALINAAQLKNALMNICINASEAMHASGEIKIRAYHREAIEGVCSSCYADLSGECLVVEVIDSGGGIKSSDLKSVFDPFFSTKDVGKGMGMGLSVVHGIIHGMDGHMSIVSEVGVGTVVRLYLKAAKCEEDSVDMNSEKVSAQKHSIKVMVVDDEDMVSNFVGELLSLNGFNVTVKNSAVEALKELSTGDRGYSLVVTDLTMPEITGLEFAETLKKNKIDIPIILYSGLIDDDVRRQAELLGITRICRKPISSLELLKAIDDSVWVEEAC